MVIHIQSLAHLKNSINAIYHNDNDDYNEDD